MMQTIQNCASLRGLPPAHSLTVQEVRARFGVSDERGLDEAEAEARREEYGPNQLPQAKPPSRWWRFLGQFLEPVIGILIAAALISGLMGDVIDTLAILAIVLLNGVIGFLQEERAERAIAALQRLSAPLAKVLREGHLQSIPARDLVPGDRIVLEGGDNIPADSRLLRAFDLRVQEAALTGESVPVAKDAEDVLDVPTPLADRTNMVYLGTTVAAGRADAVVVATGSATELGQIAGLLQRTEREPTPLQQRLAELGKVLIAIVLGIAALIFLLHALRGGPLLPSFLLSVSLAVAAVPEGLPAVVTLVLAIGLQRLVRRNALVRRLPSVETLGSVTVICSDKTGTLTRNEMTVREIVTASAYYHVSGTGYEPRGAFHLRVEGGAHGVGEAIDPQEWPDLMRALQIAAWCNTAQVAPIPRTTASGRSSETRPKGPWSSPRSRPTSRRGRETTECSTRSRSIRNARRCRSLSAGPKVPRRCTPRGHPRSSLPSATGSGDMARSGLCRLSDARRSIGYPLPWLRGPSVSWHWPIAITRTLITRRSGRKKA